MRLTPIVATMMVGLWLPSTALAIEPTPVDLTRADIGMGATGTTGPERPMDVALFADGALFAAWSQRDGTEGARVRTLRVERDGTRRAIRTVGEPHGSFGSPHPAVAARGDGSAAVAWSGPTSVALLDRSGAPVRIRQLDSGGSRTMVSVATAPGGRTIVAGAAGSSTALWILDGEGNTLHQVPLHDAEATETELHVAPDGSITVIWSVNSEVDLAVVEPDGTVSRRERVMVSENNYYRQLAFAVDAAGTATVAALNCLDNGAGTPCWFYRIEVRRVDGEGSHCLRASWTREELCSSSSYSAQSPEVLERDGAVLVAWYGGPSGGPARVRVIRVVGGTLLWGRPGTPPPPDELPPASVANAEQIIGDLGEEPGGCGYAGNRSTFISRGISGGVDTDGAGHLAWCNDHVSEVILSMDSIAVGPVSNLSAGGSQIFPPLVASHPHAEAARTAVVWQRWVDPSSSILQVRRLGSPPDVSEDEFRDVTMGSGWRTSTKLSDADSAARTPPAVAVAGNGRATVVWRSLVGDRRWATHVATSNRRGSTTPVSTIDPSLYLGDRPGPPAVVPVGASASVVALQDDAGALWLVPIDARGAVGGRVRVADHGGGSAVLSANRGHATQIAWPNGAEDLRIADVAEAGTVHNARTIRLAGWSQSAAWSIVARDDGSTLIVYEATNAQGSAEVNVLIARRDGSPVAGPVIASEAGNATLAGVSAEVGADGTIGVIWRLRFGYLWPAYRHGALRVDPDASIGSTHHLTGYAGDGGSADDEAAVVDPDGTVVLAWPAQSHYMSAVRLRTASIRRDDRLEKSHIVLEPAEEAPDASAPRAGAFSLIAAGPAFPGVLLRGSDAQAEVIANPVAGTAEEQIYDGEVLAGSVAGAGYPRGLPPFGQATPVSKESEPTDDTFSAGDVAGATDVSGGPVAAWRDRTHIRTARQINATSHSTTRPPTHNGLKCPKVWVITARGSGQTSGTPLETETERFTSTLKNRLPSEEVHYSEVAYPAVSPQQALVSIPDRLGAVLKWQLPSDYAPSVEAGVEALGEELRAITADCASVTRFVLAGYSQGAHVVGDVVQQAPDDVRSQILATILFADPRFNPDETSALGSFEHHRSGLFGARPATLATDTGHVVRSYCRRFDPVCQGLIGGCIAVKADLVAPFPVHAGEFTGYDAPEQLPLPADTVLVDAPQLAIGIAAAGATGGITAAAWAALKALAADNLSCRAAQLFGETNTLTHTPATEAAADETSRYVMDALGRRDDASPMLRAQAVDDSGPRADLHGSERPGGFRVRPNTMLTLSAADSVPGESQIVRFEWDFDGDGRFEEHGPDPQVAHRFAEQPSGAVGVRVIDGEGRADTATTSVTLDESAWAAPPTPTDVRAVPAPGGYTVSWTHSAGRSDAAERFAISSDDGAMTVVVDPDHGSSVTFADDRPGPERRFRVTASNQAGASEPSPASAPVAAGADAERSLPAVVRSSTSWLLGDEQNGSCCAATFGYGAKPLVPIMGDWDGNGSRTPGTFENGMFKLNNANDNSPADITFTFGDARGYAVSGDFNGNGTDDVAVYRNGTWQVRLSDGTIPPAFAYGPGGAWPATIPVSGDWDGDGTDGIGTYTYSAAAWNLRHTATSGLGDAGSFVYGAANSSYPVVGDWNADGVTTVGHRTGQTWTLTNSNTARTTDVSPFLFGLPGDLPLSWHR